ncbi:ankyrin repeat-containing domain protein [Zychaea mexicana]|uniref:ankyrin repeat-containing domain protein n=1 Tax=Zychaea mexicana TaxID=64656 RepID=UPI0022FE149D|nr:ankyrin repeat-containing domain protein [Zychaea mexicana]KAI9490199.1 ankyrin repeat-containing domain protein [Zychaea mexicana]
MHKWVHSPEKIRPILKELKSKGELSSAIHSVDCHGDALVHFAARAHSLEVLRIIVNECNVDVNALKRGDWTPAMIAALKGRLDVVKILEKAGANLDLCNKDGRTALHLAIQHGHVETSKYIAQRSPTSITKATKSGRLPIQIAAALCDYGPQVSYDITTFLFDHVNDSSSSSSSNSSSGSGSSLAHRDKSGRGLLQDAAVSQNLPLVRFLLDKGADPNQTDSIGRNVIHHAAMVGHLDVLELLFDDEQNQTTAKSKDISHQIVAVNVDCWDVPDRWDEWTPLMHAARQGHFPIVAFLVQHELARRNRRDKQGRTAQDIGKQRFVCV